MKNLANKQGKVSEIKASTEVLRDTIFGFQKDDADPEYEKI